MMNAASITTQLQSAQRHLDAGKRSAGLAALDVLKLAHPQDLDVALAWCQTALTIGKVTGVLPYVQRCLAVAKSTKDEATLCWLAGRAEFRAVEFESSLKWFERSVTALHQLLRAGRLPAFQARRAAPSAFADGRAEALMWQTAAALHAAGLSAFPSSGTLLALVREGRLFAWDKDVDFAIWIEDLARVEAVLTPREWHRGMGSLPVSNMLSFAHRETGLTVDVNGWRRDAAQGSVQGGFWIAGKPATYQRLTVFPWIELSTRSSPYGDVAWPAHPEQVLSAFYGNWRTPLPWFDTTISAANLTRPSLQVKNYAYMRLIGFWLRGDVDRLRDYAGQAQAACPDDDLLASIWLDLQARRPTTAAPACR